MISIRNISKSFKGNKVLSNVSLEIEGGSSWAIIGRSGNGKSVLLKNILGIIRPDSGHIVFTDSKTGIQTPQIDFTIFGMLFQNSALFDSLRIWENVAFRLIYGKNRINLKKARMMAIEKLEKTGLGAETADAYPVELSGGMQKRAALARAIMTDPKIIFFDEPTSGLDPISSNLINRLIRDISNDLGATTITITHSLASVNMIADNVAMLEHGNFIYKGSVKNMYESDNPILQQFIKI